MKNKWISILLIVVFVAGLAVFLYPAISNYVNSLSQSRAIAGYESASAGLTQNDYSDEFARADEYNRHLASLEDPFSQAETLADEYEKTLDITGTGIMGYLTIDRLGVHIPVYHSTSPEVLQVAAGHMEGSSLPIGGIGTHAVISAHRGLPSAKLFTDVDKLEIGDTFCLTTLNRTLTYQVDQILTVLPWETDEIRVDPAHDYVTLLTCTPYGINSHRLLIRGTRIESEQPKAFVRVMNEMTRVNPLIVAFGIGIVLIIVVLIILLIRKIHHERRERL